jgi:hypothetical protein
MKPVVKAEGAVFKRRSPPERGDGAKRLVERPTNSLAGQKSHFLPGCDHVSQAEQEYF